MIGEDVWEMCSHSSVYLPYNVFNLIPCLIAPVFPNRWKAPWEKLLFALSTVTTGIDRTKSTKKNFTHRNDIETQ